MKPKTWQLTILFEPFLYSHSQSLFVLFGSQQRIFEEIYLFIFCSIFWGKEGEGVAKAALRIRFPLIQTLEEMVGGELENDLAAFAHYAGATTSTPIAFPR